MWCRRAMIIHLQQYRCHSDTSIITSALIHTQQNEPAGPSPLLPGKRDFSAIFCWYAYLERLGMDERLQRVDVSLKDTLTSHTPIAGMCPATYGTEGLNPGWCNYRQPLSTYKTVHYCDDTTPAVVFEWESKRCTLLEVSWQWLQSMKDQIQVSKKEAALLAAHNDLWPLCL